MGRLLRVCLGRLACLLASSRCELFGSIGNARARVTWFENRPNRPLLTYAARCSMSDAVMAETCRGTKPMGLIHSGRGDS